MITYAEILVIDDMPDQITFIGNLLQSEGYRVFAATSGKAARRFLEGRLPELILLDIHLDDVDGLEICRKLKSSPKTKDIPIIFLTASVELDTISRAFELGGSDYIRKPFSKEEFLARISTQLRLSQQRKELVAANDELSQFCTAVTHDLKAPFTVINMFIGKLQEMLGDEVGADVNQIMDMIMLKSAQAKTMIERLFEFSRMCNVKPKISEVDVKAIVEETFEDLHSLCPEREIDFTCGDLPIVNADETLVRMAVKNLLQNAIKYSSKKPKSVISVSQEHNSAYHIIKVEDNGAGFDMQYVGKIFQVFERLHYEEDFPGTGVGLALVNRIMLRHNGRIEAYGEVDKGAYFKLFFPKSIKPVEE